MKMILISLALLCAHASAAEPATYQDPNFPLIRLPAEFRAQRQSTDVRLAKGQTVEIFKQAGAGCVRHIWFCPNKPEGNGILRICADGADQPQVEMTVQQFMGVLLGQKPYRVDCAAFQHLPMMEGTVQGPGYNCYLPIPFRNGCRITFEAAVDCGLAVQVDWQQYAADAEVTPYRLHAVYRGEFPATHRALFPMASASGRGFVAGIFKGIRQRDFGDMIYHTKGQIWLIDGETDPHAINGHNEEDDFSFFWGYQHIMTPWIGSPYNRVAKREDQDGVIYRFFGPDPVPFKSSLVLRCGSRADDTETVVYYYRILGSEPKPVESPAKWQVVGPWASPDFDQFQKPEAPERQAAPWPATFDGKPVHEDVPEHTWVDFWRYYREGGAPEALVGHSIYARTTISSDAQRAVQIRLGFDDWLTVWLNGKKLGTYRHDDGFKQIAIPAQLRAGANELLIKYSNFRENQRRLWALSCSIADRP